VPSAAGLLLGPVPFDDEFELVPDSGVGPLVVVAGCSPEHRCPLPRGSFAGHSCLCPNPPSQLSCFPLLSAMSSFALVQGPLPHFQLGIQTPKRRAFETPWSL